METQRQVHPSERQLAAFALERLTPESLAKLQPHLASCSTCAEFVQKTPRETLIELLKQNPATPSQRERGTVAALPARSESPTPFAPVSGQAETALPSHRNRHMRCGGLLGRCVAAAIVQAATNLG